MQCHLNIAGHSRDAGNSLVGTEERSRMMNLDSDLRHTACPGVPAFSLEME